MNVVMFNRAHEKKAFGENAPDQQRGNKTMASEAAAIFCSGTNALSLLRERVSPKKRFHSETHASVDKSFLGARRHVWLVVVLRHFCLFKERRNIKSPWDLWVKFDSHEGHLYNHQRRLNPKLRSTAHHQMSWTNLCPATFS